MINPYCQANMFLSFHTIQNIQMDGLIQWCISTTRFFVLLNGTLNWFFQSLGSLRQGEHLPLFLFLLELEILSNVQKREMLPSFPVMHVKSK